MTEQAGGVSAAIKKAYQQGREDQKQIMILLVANDAWAMTFQSLGQYRTALLAELGHANE